MKILFSILIVLFAFIVSGQTKPTEVTPDSYILAPTYSYVSETLTNTDTITHVYRVQGNNAQNFTIKLYLDWVSGTAGGVLSPYVSMDGITYAVLDTVITASSVTADIMDTETIDIDNLMYPYLKLIYIQSGTAVTIPKLYLYTKKN